MNLFNHKHKLKKYNDVYEIIDDFYKYDYWDILKEKNIY